MNHHDYFVRQGKNYGVVGASMWNMLALWRRTKVTELLSSLDVSKSVKFNRNSERSKINTERIIKNSMLSRINIF